MIAYEVDILQCLKVLQMLQTKITHEYKKIDLNMGALDHEQEDVNSFLTCRKNLLSWFISENVITSEKATLSEDFADTISWMDVLIEKFISPDQKSSFYRVLTFDDRSLA